MAASDEGLRVALLTYRGNPHSGGQGVYVRYLSRALVELGHRVEVLSGQPYPDLAEGVRLIRVPSLDLYRADDPFRRPRLREFRDVVDAAEYALMCSAAFPEPLTFSLRAARILRARRADVDVVHDNQCLGYGLISVLRAGLPVIATVHHPITIDRRLDLAHATGWRKRLALRRWYSFVRMQARVARRLPRLITVSESAGHDVVRDFGVEPARMGIVHNGVDADLFRPLGGIARVPGRIVTTASADAPIKGLAYLVEALAKLRTEHNADLVVIGRTRRSGAVARAIDRFGLEGVVRFVSGVDSLRIVEEYARAEVAVVPSLYEGFSLPALEAMSCGVPVVATRAGALPEVVGLDGDAALLVPAGDSGALAAAVARLLDDQRLRARMGERARARVLGRFTWREAARATVEEYRTAMAAC